jgi:antitoxin (DNA-binding transcriptional repressor) of toxin-antitoxin stability system
MSAALTERVSAADRSVRDVRSRIEAEMASLQRSDDARAARIAAMKTRDDEDRAATRRGLDKRVADAKARRQRSDADDVSSLAAADRLARDLGFEVETSTETGRSAARITAVAAGKSNRQSLFESRGRLVRPSSAKVGGRDTGTLAATAGTASISRLESTTLGSQRTATTTTADQARKASIRPQSATVRSGAAIRLLSGGR